VLINLKDKSAIHQLLNNVPTALPLAQADPLRLERIIYNLVDNAIKYSPNGGDVVVAAYQQAISYRYRSATRARISAVDQARLFQSFERLGLQ